MAKTIGFDLGVGSIGSAIRNTELSSQFPNQLEYFGADIFDSGVISDQESNAAHRSSIARTRRLYDTRRRKLWATLHLLLDYGLCPIEKKSLFKWETYDKKKGHKREYPINDILFNNWIKLDFDGDGSPDYSSPFQLRKELVSTQLDFSQTVNRYKLGRALYHIAQHRGFKSTKGEKINEQIDDNISFEESSGDYMKKSEEKKSSILRDYMKAHNLTTVGEAFADLELNGKRIRESDFQAVRSQLIEEIKTIFQFQKGLQNEIDLLTKLISTKKGCGTIFYTKSHLQKGSIGKCCLEPQKQRCPLSHPEYEKFRAWQTLNNIKIKINGEVQGLSLDIKQKLYNKLFISRVKTSFAFSEVRELLNNELNVSLMENDVNYKDYQTISGCPITARFRKMLGENWETWEQSSEKQHNGKKTKSHIKHNITYSAYDLWSFCFQADSKEDVIDFATMSLKWNTEKTKLLTLLWDNMGIGYASLSLKAMRSINRFLLKGCLYSDAVLLAKIPDVIDLSATEIDEILHHYLNVIKKETDRLQFIYKTANSLIERYKSAVASERLADHDFNYILDDQDKKDVLAEAKNNKNWTNLTNDEHLIIIKETTILYQKFFNSFERKKYPVPTLGHNLVLYLKKRYPEVCPKKWEKLYHPSMINKFHPCNVNEKRESWRLGYPELGAIKNPQVLRVLNILRNKVNYMLDKDLIRYDTHVVIETTREEHDTNELNDANKRIALSVYQNTRKEENKAIAEFLLKEFPDLFKTEKNIPEDDIKKTRLAIEQSESTLDEDIFTSTNKYYSKKADFKKYIDRFKLLLQQDFTCLYTGRIINFSSIFDENKVDIEHTIPRSIYPDNSDTNTTVCDAYYNRHIKKNRIPTQLENYENDITIKGVVYTAIRPRLVKWEERVKELEKRVEFWISRSRKAQDKETKDYCIQQRHLWSLELNYWRTKLNTFTIEEVNEGFSNKSLVDTCIITKYAISYLKSVFTRVDAQKGSVTSVFRKIFGIQDIYEKKSRNLHSHHAIDAAVLTIIPTNAKKRDRMIKLFYQIQETKILLKYETNEQERTNLNIIIRNLEESLAREKDDCDLGNNINCFVNRINDEIVINRNTKDCTFAPAKRYIRNGGRKVVNKKNNSTFLYSAGDSIRADLHEKSFYGAIKKPIVANSDDNNTKYKIENGRFVYDKEDPFIMVIRKNLKDFTKEKDLNNIIDPAVRERLLLFVKNNSLNKLKTADIYMLDKNGKEIRFDKNGRPLCPIRHVRCKVTTGRGFLKYDTARKIKKHTNVSGKTLVNLINNEHKQYYYVKNSNAKYLLLYEHNTGNNISIRYRVLFPIDLIKFAQTHTHIDYDFLKHNQEYATLVEDGKEYKLSALIKAGTRVMLWKDKPEELQTLLPIERNKRIFEVLKFNGDNKVFNIYLRLHIDATTNKDLRPEQISKIYNDLDIRDKTNIKKLKCLVEERDFTIDPLGYIHLKNRQ